MKRSLLREGSYVWTTEPCPVDPAVSLEAASADASPGVSGVGGAVPSETGPSWANRVESQVEKRIEARILAAESEASRIVQMAGDRATRLVADARAEAERGTQSIRTDAENALAAARAESTRIVGAAAEELERLRQASRAEGFASGSDAGRQTGRVEGFEAVRREADESLKRLEGVVASAREERARILAAAESEMVSLALAVARKVLGDALKAEPEAVVHIVREAIAKATVKERLTVRVNPADANVVARHRADLLAGADGSKVLEVVEDPRITPGGCVVDTPAGSVDARLERQVAEIAKALSGVR